MGSKLVHGARVNCYINGQKAGTVVSFQFSSDTPHREARGIDSLLPFELIQQASSIKGTIGLLRQAGGGGAQGLGAGVKSFKLTREKYFTLALIDRGTGFMLFRADYCCINNEAWQLATKQFMTGTVNFSGLLWDNEAPNPV